MKVFISQPMRGRTAEEIKLERKEIMQHIRETFSEDAEEIQSYFGENGPEGDRTGLKSLGKSLELMDEADMVYFAKGWEDSRGCGFENTAAIAYGITVVEDYRKEQRTKEEQK